MKYGNSLEPQCNTLSASDGGIMVFIFPYATMLKLLSDVRGWQLSSYHEVTAKVS